MGQDTALCQTVFYVEEPEYKSRLPLDKKRRPRSMITRAMKFYILHLFDDHRLVLRGQSSLESSYKSTCCLPHWRYLLCWRLMTTEAVHLCAFHQLILYIFAGIMLVRASSVQSVLRRRKVDWQTSLLTEVLYIDGARISSELLS